MKKLLVSLSFACVAINSAQALTYNVTIKNNTKQNIAVKTAAEQISPEQADPKVQSFPLYPDHNIANGFEVAPGQNQTFSLRGRTTNYKNDANQWKSLIYRFTVKAATSGETNNPFKQSDYYIMEYAFSNPQQYDSNSAGFEVEYGIGGSTKFRTTCDMHIEWGKYADCWIDTTGTVDVVYDYQIIDNKTQLFVYETVNPGSKNNWQNKFRWDYIINDLPGISTSLQYGLSHESALQASTQSSLPWGR